MSIVLPVQGDPPVGRRRLDFRALSPGEFELLCYLVVLIGFPKAVRFAAPDGGADSGLPTADRRFLHCWQAKRFTDHIAWSQCVASLDAAVTNYGMRCYTFCFARDLTLPQERNFRKHLVGRHTGVSVDYWSSSRLEAMLLGSEQGQRIANEFYGDPQFNTRAIARAIRAGGPLESGAHVLERLKGIADHLAERDPYYAYTTITREAGVPGPLLTPEAIMAVETGDAKTVERIEAIPRNVNAIHPPEGTLHFEDTPQGREQAASLRRFFSHGGDLRLDGVRFELRNLPPLFEDISGGPEGTGTILLRSPRTPIPPWDARFIADTDRGRSHLDVLLRQDEPPAGWDAALTGSFGGLTVTVTFRTFEVGGQMRVHWSYTYSIEAPIREQAKVLAFIDAAHGVGTVALEDKQSLRPSVVEKLTGRDVDSELTGLRRFLEGLVVIEDWTGHEFKLPEFVPRDEVQAVIEAAQIIESGRSRMNVDEIELVMPVEKYVEVLQEPGRFAAGVTFGIVVLGDEVSIGELRGELPDVGVETKQILEDGREMVQLWVRPTSEEGRHPLFTLHREPQRED